MRVEEEKDPPQSMVMYQPQSALPETCEEVHMTD